MRLSTLPSPLASTCHDTKVFGLAQLGLVTGSGASCVLNERTIPWAPESTETDVMSVGIDCSLSLVSRLITSPAGSVIAAGAATAAGGATKPATLSSVPTVTARPAAIFRCTILDIRHPQSQAPR